MDFTRRRCQLLLVYAFWFLSGCSQYVLSSPAIPTPRRLVDLSFLHRTPSFALAKCIQEELKLQQNESRNETEVTVDLDVTASFRGKEIKDLIASLTETESKLKIRLTAQHNGWSHQEVTTLLNALLNSTNGKQDIINSTVFGNKGNETGTNGTAISRYPATQLASLDLGWNKLGASAASRSTNRRTSKAFLRTLQRTIQETKKCPLELRFPVCSLGAPACRSIGKGIIARYSKDTTTRHDNDTLPPPLVLDLTRNEDIGDAGVTAISAALRTVAQRHPNCTVLRCLDLSGCGVGDVGAEALAMALEKSPCCVLHLNLANNKISDKGAAALGHSLVSSESECAGVTTLDLSNNLAIGDSGARSLAAALQQGALNNLVARSCKIRADGAACLVRAVLSSSRAPGSISPFAKKSLVRTLDLSGNPLGILQSTSKSSTYSATALRSKASATTAAYMTLIGKTVQKGLKDIGIADAIGSTTLESDDEEETRMGGLEEGDEDPSKVKCGALAIADGILSNDKGGEEVSETTVTSSQSTTGHTQLGLRHCFLDTRAAEALAAVKEHVDSAVGLGVTIDVRMNNVLEEETVAALRGDNFYKSVLHEMAERYQEAMETLRIARERSSAAAKATADRMRTEEELENAWGAAVDMGEDDDSYREEGWDSSRDYDDEDYF